MASRTPAQVSDRIGSAECRKRRSAPRNWRAVFIAHLAQTSSIENAAQSAGISPTRAYQARREEPEFAQDWQSALAEGYVHLEMEVLRRLRDGDFQTDGAERYDMANAIRLLVSRGKSGSGFQHEGPDISAAEVRASIDRKIADIRRRVGEAGADETSAR